MDGVVVVDVATAERPSSFSPAASQLSKTEEIHTVSLTTLHGDSAVVSKTGVERRMGLLVGHDEGGQNLPK
jgi:hypothetical protein